MGKGEIVTSRLVKRLVSQGRQKVSLCGNLNGKHFEKHQTLHERYDLP